MKSKLPLFLVALVFFVACVFLLSRSPVWPQLGFYEFMVMIAAGLSLGILILVVAICIIPKQPPTGQSSEEKT